MNEHQTVRADYKGGCGSMNRSRMGGPWGRRKWGNFWTGPTGRSWGAQPPVNIEEDDERYVISLFAAGLSKEKVMLTVKDDVLRIAYSGPDQAANAEADPQRTYTYQEYNQSGFERSFRLNDKVLVDSISASYADGILRVTLPKKPATNTPAQTITVA